MTKSLDHDPFGDSDHAEYCDYLSDSDLEDDVEVAEPVKKDHRMEERDKNSSEGAGFRDELDRQGKVVVLRGVSYLTLVTVDFPSPYLLTDLGRFQALVMYLYTGEIDFAPFGSKSNRELRTPELLSTAEDTIPRPSPKSIYRIADMVSATTVATIAN